VLNFAIVLKNARNDYIFIRQQLLPCALTTLVVVTCFAAIIAYRYGVSRDMPRPDQARYLLFAEIYAFVTLNISFLFKETSSPLKDVANDVRALHRIANSKATSAEQRQQQWSALTAAAKALTSSLAKHSATLTARFDVDGTKYDLAGAAKAVGDLADKLAPEVTAKRLADRNSELSQLVRGVVANVAR
jgi:hypothetical protein